MTKNDWYDTGEQIKKLVQDAIDSKDFSQLSGTITNVLNQTVDGLQTAIRENFTEHTKEDASKTNEEKNGEAEPSWKEERTNGEAAQRIRRNMQQKQKERKAGADRQELRVQEKAPGMVSGMIMKWMGYSMGSLFALAVLILLITAAAVGGSVYRVLFTISGCLAVVAGMCTAIGICGSRRLSLARRFNRYRKILGDRTYCLIEELASAIGKDHAFVSRDLKKMIQGGFFREGYLDKKETVLITDRQTYQQYLETQDAYEQRCQDAGRQAEEAGRKADGMDGTAKEKTEDEKNLTPKQREIVEEGNRYIRHIRACNDRIPGEAMSEKLDRLELVMTRIFQEAEKNPDAADDLKKMMSYYLPTTQKLLDAYCEMDLQPIQGETIEHAKKEIEDSLDTVNTAFEKLLDRFFEEKAWDISADIQVLQTMLAQEGLTGNDFEKQSTENRGKEG